MAGGCVGRQALRVLGQGPKHAFQRKPLEATISLINVVFLMLIFFLVAGSLVHRTDQHVNPIQLVGVEGAMPEDAVIMLADGRLWYEGQFFSDDELSAQLAGEASVRLYADRDTPAYLLIYFTQSLRHAGVQQVMLVVQPSSP